MEFDIVFAGICLRLAFPEEAVCDPWLLPFLGTGKEAPDVTVRFTWDRIDLPRCAPQGQDVLQEYYFEDGTWYCALMGGNAGPVSVTAYDPQFSRVICSMGDLVQGWRPLRLSAALRMLPMGAIFSRFGVLFLHASQIRVGDRGILFAAPSGTGKTTQARLWNRHRGAEILCNDRVLIRDGTSYGYPLDGSSPVRWDGSCRVGALVLLEQWKENRVERLKPGRAIPALLPQTVIDSWNTAAVNQTMLELMALMERCPVYRLRCTKEEDAVDCLERQLIADGVISDEY